jgi:hypothetical protein
MLKKRTMALVGSKISFEEAEDSDIIFWANKTIIERLAETERLRKMIWTHVLGSYPVKMEKVGGFVKRPTLDA